MRIDIADVVEQAMRDAPRGCYEIVIPVIDGKEFGERHELIYSSEKMQLKIKDDKHFFAVYSFRRRKVYVLGDFYDFSGNKHSMNDIKAHYNTYMHGVYSIQQKNDEGVSTEGLSFAYHYRRVWDKGYVRNRMRRWRDVPA